MDKLKIKVIFEYQHVELQKEPLKIVIKIKFILKQIQKMFPDKSWQLSNSIELTIFVVAAMFHYDLIQMLYLQIHKNFWMPY